MVLILRRGSRNAGTVTASALNGVIATPNEMGASASDTMPLAASQQLPAESMQTPGYPAASKQMPSVAAQLPAAQAVLPSGAMSALGRRRLDEVNPLDFILAPWAPPCMHVLRPSHFIRGLSTCYCVYTVASRCLQGGA